MVGTVLSIIGFALFLVALAVLYLWTRRTEADSAFEQAPGIKTDEQAGAIRLGIALNQGGNQLGGH